MKILFATPECAPWVKTGGLGDVSGALPLALRRLGHDVRVLLPAYSGMKVAGEMGDAVEIPAQGPWPAAQLLPVRADNGMHLLLLACPLLYQRAGGPYVTPSGHDHHDNAFRFAFFSRIAAALGTPATPVPGWQADVVHANDWPSGLAPLYLRQARDAGAASAASVITIHNISFQGHFPLEICDVLGIAPRWRGMDGVEFWGQLSMLKAALQFSDAITTVSPTYAKEIQTEEFGVGLHGVLAAHASRLTGILNGIDRHVWDSSADPLIPHHFSAGDLAGKSLDKAALQRRCGLRESADAMLFGVVSRLTSQKGIDLVMGAAEAIVEAGGQLVVLGQGERALEEALLETTKRHPGEVSATIGFNEGLAHLVEAGADCFLMPSRFEPCGLNQMYSQAYGTPPVVTPTGGLRDSVVDERDDPLGATGFVMEAMTPEAFDDGWRRALAAWRDPPRWRRLQENGMTRRFGWEDSAFRYVAVYEQALVRRG